MFNRAVQGQNGAQPEGALFNFINWIGNVVAPVMAGGDVFGAIVAFISGRGFSLRRHWRYWPWYSRVSRSDWRAAQRL